MISAPLAGLRARLAAATGAAAESRAEQYLRAQGLTLVARNWRCRQGELDLLMRSGETLVIVEVRARSHAGYGGAAGSVDRRKQGRIAAAAQQFLIRQPQWAEAPVRFDVLGYEADGRCHWLQAAFTLDDLT